MTNITIIGSGFAALTVVRTLRRLKVAAGITLISPREHLEYLPSIIWMPPHLRHAENLCIPLDDFFARHKVQYIKASITGLKEGGRVVVTGAGEFRNDHLVIASGGRFIRKLPGIEHALIPCEGVAVGAEITRRLDGMIATAGCPGETGSCGTGGTIAIGFGANPKEPGAVRGGPMFELLFILDTYLRHAGFRDKIAISFFSGAKRPGQRLGAKAVDGLLKEMQLRHITTHLGHKPKQFTDGKVITEGEEIPADLILFMPGITGPDWLQNTELPLSEGGMVRADALCRAEGTENIWVAGDVGSFPGPDWMPKQAHQADLQAVTVAKNIREVLHGHAPHHHFRPELICIVDTLDAGMLVFRNPRFNLTLPRMKLFHALKRYFERIYLRPYLPG